MKTTLVSCFTFVIGVVCAFGYFHLQNTERTDKAWRDGYSAGVIATSLNAIQDALAREVEETHQAKLNGE
jgi:hypothetical protein